MGFIIGFQTKPIKRLAWGALAKAGAQNPFYRAGPLPAQGSGRVDGPQHGHLRFLPLAAAANQAGFEVIELAVAVDGVDVDPVPCPGRAAMLALDLEAAPEADEIAGGADMLVGHEAALRG